MATRSRLAFFAAVGGGSRGLGARAEADAGRMVVAGGPAAERWVPEAARQRKPEAVAACKSVRGAGAGTGGSANGRKSDARARGRRAESSVADPPGFAACAGPTPARRGTACAARPSAPASAEAPRGSAASSAAPAPARSGQPERVRWSRTSRNPSAVRESCVGVRPVPCRCHSRRLSAVVREAAVRLGGLAT